ncbi:hypothetical protein COTS27_01044 [Spirochaetota bacterium]|nr:hypothetical protein COTS27_01044 [Spirochaetota bacterium]
MPTYKINGKNFPWPQEGDRDWGGKITDFVFALTTTVNNLISKVIVNNKDQTITGEKVFATPPKVLVRHNENTPSTPHTILHSAQPINIDTLLSNIETNISNLRQLIGASTENTILPADLAQRILSLVPTDIHSIKNYLTGIIEHTDQLTPLGSLKAIYKPPLQDNFIAKWIPCADDEPNAVYLLQEYIDTYQMNTQQQQIIDGSAQGYYKISGGNWALCDGTLLLPLIFGSAGTSVFGGTTFQNAIRIPNLLDNVFLKGSLSEPSHITGTNTLTLTTAHIPSHHHQLRLSTTTSEEGAHRHTHAKSVASLNRTTTQIPSSGNHYVGVNIRTTELNPYTSTSGDHTHNVAINGNTENTGSGSEIDKTPKHLPVKYYLRVH